MKHAFIGLRFLFPSDKNPPKAVVPAVRSLDDPSPGLRAAFLFFRGGFLAARADVRRVSESLNPPANFVVVVAFVEAQVLRLLGARPWTIDRNALDCLPRQLEVIHVRAGHRQSDRHAAAFGQQASLHAGFGPIRRVWPAFFPRRAAPSSSLHPCSAISSRCPSVRHNTTGHRSTASSAPRPEPIPETGDAPRNWSRCRLRSGHSTGSRYATRTAMRRTPHDRSRAADRRRTGGCSCEPATADLRTPTVGPSNATAWMFSSPPSLAPPFRASCPIVTSAERRFLG